MMFLPLFHLPVLILPAVHQKPLPGSIRTIRHLKQKSDFSAIGHCHEFWNSWFQIPQIKVSKTGIGWVSACFTAGFKSPHQSHSEYAIDYELSAIFFIGGRLRVRPVTWGDDPHSQPFFCYTEACSTEGTSDIAQNEAMCNLIVCMITLTNVV